MHTRKQVVGYVRVSVDSPDKVSPDIQAEDIKRFCELKQWDLVDTIIERGRSAGEGKKRPGLDRARTLIRTGKSSGLIVWKLDRASRSVTDFANLMTELRKHDAAFVSITESFDTSTPHGRFTLNVMMALAEMERDRMGERATAWQGWRARKGLPPTGRPTFGYDLIDGQLVINEETGPIVKQAVNVFLETGNQLAVLRYLQSVGHSRWYTAIQRLISTPTIAGMREIDGVLVDGNWPGIIDVDTHRKVVELLNDRETRGRRPDRWMLTGIAMCGRTDCGLPLAAGQVNPGPARYRCSRVNRPHMDTPMCALGIRRDEFEAFVERRVLHRIDPAMWQRMRAGLKTEQSPPVVDLVALNEKMNALTDRWLDGRISDAEWDYARETLTSRIDTAEAELAEAADDEFDLPDVDNLHKAWPTMSDDAKRLVVAAVINQIIVLPNIRPGRRPKNADVDALIQDRVRIFWRKPAAG